MARKRGFVAPLSSLDSRPRIGVRGTAGMSVRSIEIPRFARNEMGEG